MGNAGMSPLTRRNKYRFLALNLALALGSLLLIPHLITAAAPAPLVGWPVRGRISQPFGCSRFYSGIPASSCPAGQPWFHDGLDLAVPIGQPVRAAISGTVLFAGADGSGPACGRYRGYGLAVVIDSGRGWQTLYAHLSDLFVVKGQPVRPDTLLGLSGATGCVSGSHLHFGLRGPAGVVDPLLHLEP